MGSSGKNAINGAMESSIPTTTREIVSNLKEIVNCNEQEIYAILEDCNMDPDQAVQRLLDLDTFHEVKSKREKKREPKGTTESRSQRVSSSSGRGLIAGNDRGRRRSSVQNSSNDNGLGHGKPVPKKENEASVLPTYDEHSNHDSLSTAHAPQKSDNVSLTSQSSLTYEQCWSGLSGQLSLADIVKMGRPQQKPSSTPANNIPPSKFPLELYSSQFPVLKSTEISHVPSNVVSRDKSLEVRCEDDKPSEEFVPVVSDTSGSAAVADYLYLPAFSLHAGGTDLQRSPHVDNIGNLEVGINGENLQTDLSIPDKQSQVENSDGISGFDHETFEDSYSRQPQTVPHEQLEGHSAEHFNEVLSSTAVNFQHLHLLQEEQGATENPAVIIPDHLQVNNADCAHLCFGSFVSAGATFPVVTSNLHENNADEVSENASPPYQSGDRNPEHYNTDQLETALDNSVARGTDTTSRNNGVASVSKQEAIRDETFDIVNRLQNLPSIPRILPENHAEASIQAQNVPPVTNLLQSYTDSLSSSLPVGSSQTISESDPRLFANQSMPPTYNNGISFPSGPSTYDPELSYTDSLSSSLPVGSSQTISESDPRLFANQSMPPTYNNGISFPSGPSTYDPEALKQSLFSRLQPPPQIVPNTPSAATPAFPGHLPIHPFSQPNISVGPLPDMIRSPFLSQSIHSEPFSGSSAFHHIPSAFQSAGMKYALPQHKYISLNDLPKSHPVASGYGGLGISANIPGSFHQNYSTAAANMTVGHDGLRSQFKEGDLLSLLHQRENSLPWMHGAGPQTVPAFPGDRHYAIQGQNQPGSSILRLLQQPQSAHAGTAGYSNSYQPQSDRGISREQQQQLLSQAELDVLRSKQTQQSRHFW